MCEIIINMSFFIPPTIVYGPIPNQKTFSWDPVSAARKFGHDSTISVGIPGVVNITKQTSPNNPERDAYRNCSRCHKHWNYHKNGQCPK